MQGVYKIFLFERRVGVEKYIDYFLIVVSTV